MLLDIPQCTGKPPATKGYLAPNAMVGKRILSPSSHSPQYLLVAELMVLCFVFLFFCVWCFFCVFFFGGGGGSLLNGNSLGNRELHPQHLPNCQAHLALKSCPACPCSENPPQVEDVRPQLMSLRKKVSFQNENRNHIYWWVFLQ